MGVKSVSKNQFRIIALIWTVLMVSFFLADIFQVQRDKYDYALNEARSNLNKDIGIRMWTASHGGVYVPVTEETTPNPGLDHISERDIETPTGVELTLMNPAYLMRQLNEYFSEAYDIHGHITSTRLIRPENAPDPWERMVLQLFEDGQEEYHDYVILNDSEYFRLMEPLYINQSCLKCHGHQGYEIGDLRGGISVAIPMEKIHGVFDSQIRLHGWISGILWLLGVAGITITSKVTRRQQAKQLEAEKVLYTSQENLSITLNSISDGVIVVDKQRRILRMNPVAETITAWSISEARGKPILEVYKTSKQKDSPYPRLTKELISRNGESFQIFETESEMRNRDMEQLGYVIVFKDVSEELLLEKELNQSKKLSALGLLAGGVAHDFNNMLSIILSSTELLMEMEDLKAADKRASYIRYIQDASLQAADLVKKLLLFSQKKSFEMKPMDMHSLLESTKSLLERTIDKGITILIALEAKKTTIIGNRSDMENMIVNVSVNACHAMAQRGNLYWNSFNTELDEVFCRDTAFDIIPGEFFVLEIKDEGEGIPKENLSKIFEPFFSTKGQEKGTGLGLPTVYGIMKNHRGAIEVESEINEGTVFRFFLPLN